MGSVGTLILIGPFIVDKRLANIEDGNALSAKIEARLDSQVEHFAQQFESVNRRIDMLGGGEWTEEDNQALLDEVVAIQKKYVQDSWGVSVGEFYTESDYNMFKRKDEASAAVKDFSQSSVYAQLKSKLAAVDAETFKNVLAAVKSQFQITWNEAGSITREAQTSSGQQAQKDIAAAIADFIQQSRSEMK